jgi:hypothetical protein
MLLLIQGFLHSFDGQGLLSQAGGTPALRPPRDTLPRIVIGTNDPIHEAVPHVDGQGLPPQAGGTPALRPPRDTLPRIVIGGLDQEGERICSVDSHSILQTSRGCAP